MRTYSFITCVPSRKYVKMENNLIICKSNPKMRKVLTLHMDLFFHQLCKIPFGENWVRSYLINSWTSRKAQEKWEIEWNRASTLSTREGLDKDEKETDCLNLYRAHIIMGKKWICFTLSLTFYFSLAEHIPFFYVLCYLKIQFLPTS